MEKLLSHAAHGTHILFNNKELKNILKEAKQDREFFDFPTLEKVQKLMTELMNKKYYHDKIAFLEQLDQETYEILVRSYFHLVEHTAFAKSNFNH